MDQLIAKTWMASLVLHASLLLPLVSFAAASAPDIYDDGAGRDAFRVEKGLTVEMVSFGDAVEQNIATEAALMIASPAPVLEQKPVEPDLKTIITAKVSPTETAAVTEDIPPPQPPKRPDAALRDQAAQEAQISQRSAGLAVDGGKTTALNAYVGKIRGALQRVKASTADAATAAGKVTLAVTVDAAGKVVGREVIKSSGIASLDRAAVEWLERATLPPLPDLLGTSLRLDVPLNFGRKSG